MTNNDVSLSTTETLTPTYTTPYNRIEPSLFPQSHDPFRPAETDRPPSPGVRPSSPGLVPRGARPIPVSSIRSSLKIDFDDETSEWLERRRTVPAINHRKETLDKQISRTGDGDKTEVRYNRGESNIEIRKEETIERDQQLYKVKQIVVVSRDDQADKDEEDPDAGSGQTVVTEKTNNMEIADRVYGDTEPVHTSLDAGSTNRPHASSSDDTYLEKVQNEIQQTDAGYEEEILNAKRTILDTESRGMTSDKRNRASKTERKNKVKPFETTIRSDRKLSKRDADVLKVKERKERRNRDAKEDTQAHMNRAKERKGHWTMKSRLEAETIIADTVDVRIDSMKTGTDTDNMKKAREDLKNSEIEISDESDARSVNLSNTIQESDSNEIAGKENDNELDNKIVQIHSVSYDIGNEEMKVEDNYVDDFEKDDISDNDRTIKHPFMSPLNEDEMDEFSIKAHETEIRAVPTEEKEKRADYDEKEDISQGGMYKTLENFECHHKITESDTALGNQTHTVIPETAVSEEIQEDTSKYHIFDADSSGGLRIEATSKTDGGENMSLVTTSQQSQTQPSGIGTLVISNSSINTLIISHEGALEQSAIEALSKQSQQELAKTEQDGTPDTIVEEQKVKLSEKETLFYKENENECKMENAYLDIDILKQPETLKLTRSGAESMENELFMQNGRTETLNTDNNIESSQNLDRGVSDNVTSNLEETHILDKVISPDPFEIELKRDQSSFCPVTEKVDAAEGNSKDKSFGHEHLGDSTREKSEQHKFDNSTAQTISTLHTQTVCSSETQTVSSAHTQTISDVHTQTAENTETQTDHFAATQTTVVPITENVERPDALENLPKTESQYVFEKGLLIAGMDDLLPLVSTDPNISDSPKYVDEAMTLQPITKNSPETQNFELVMPNETRDMNKQAYSVSMEAEAEEHSTSDNNSKLAKTKKLFTEYSISTDDDSVSTDDESKIRVCAYTKKTEELEMKQNKFIEAATINNIMAEYQDLVSDDINSENHNNANFSLNKDASFDIQMAEYIGTCKIKINANRDINTVEEETILQSDETHVFTFEEIQEIGEEPTEGKCSEDWIEIGDLVEGQNKQKTTLTCENTDVDKRSEKVPDYRDDLKQEIRELIHDAQNNVKEEENANESNIIAEVSVSDQEKEFPVVEKNENEDTVSAEMENSNTETAGSGENQQEDTVSAEIDLLQNESADFDESFEKVLSESDEEKIKPTQKTGERTEEDQIKEFEEEAQVSEKEKELEVSVDDQMKVPGNRTPDGGKYENVNAVSTGMDVSEKDKGEINHESENESDQSNEDIGSKESDISEKVTADEGETDVNVLDQINEQKIQPSKFVEPTETDKSKEILEVVPDSVTDKEREDAVSRADIDDLNKAMPDVDEDSTKIQDQSTKDREKPKSPIAVQIETEETEDNVRECQHHVSSIIEHKSEILPNNTSQEQTEFIGNEEGISKESYGLVQMGIFDKDMGDTDETVKEDTKIREGGVLEQEKVDVEDSNEKGFGQSVEDKSQATGSRLNIMEDRKELTDDQQSSSESCNQNESDTQEPTISEATKKFQIDEDEIIVPDVSNKYLTNEIYESIKGDPDSDLIGNESQTENETIQSDYTKQETKVLTPDKQNIVKEEETAKESNIVAEFVVNDPEKEITVINEDVVSAEMGVSDRETDGTCENRQENTVSEEINVLDNEYFYVHQSRVKVLSQNDDENIKSTQNTQEMTEEEVREIEEEAEVYEKENEHEKEASVDAVINISGNKTPDGGKHENVDSLSTDMDISEKDKMDVKEESEKLPDQSNEDVVSLKSDVSDKVKADVDEISMTVLDQTIAQELIPSEYVEPTNTDEIKKILAVVQDSAKKDGRETEDTVSAKTDVLNKEMADVDEDTKHIKDQSDDAREKPKSPITEDKETDEKEENFGEGQNNVSSIVEPKSEITPISTSLEQTELIGNDEGIGKESSALTEMEISGKDMGDADETAREDTKIGGIDVLVQETVVVKDGDENDLGQIAEDKLQPTVSRLDIDQSRQERTDDQQPSSESCDQNEPDTQERTICEPTETIQIAKGENIVPDVSSKDLTNEIDERMKRDPESDLIGNEFLTGNEPIQPDDTKQETRVLTPDEENIVKEGETDKESKIDSEGVVSEPGKEINVIDENAIEDVVSAGLGTSVGKTVGTCKGKQEDAVSTEMDVLNNEYADIDEIREKVLSQNDENNIEPTQNTQEMTEEEEIRQIEEEMQGYEKESEPEKETSVDEVMNISGTKSPDRGKLENVDSLSTDMNISEKDNADVNEESEKEPDQSNEDIGSIKSDVSEKVKAELDDGSVHDFDQGIQQELIPSEFVEPTETDEIKAILKVVQDSFKEDRRETEDTVSAEIDVLNKEMADVDEDSKKVIDKSDDDKEKPKSPKADDKETDEKEENVGEGQIDVSSIIAPTSEILQKSASLEQTEFIGNDEEIAKESTALAETKISGKDMGDADETARVDTKIGEADVLVQDSVDVENSEEKDLGQIGEDKLQPTDFRLDIDQSRQERTDDQQPSSESCDKNDSDTQERTICEPTETIQTEKGGIIVPDVSSKDLTNEIDEHMKGDPESVLIGNKFQTGNESIRPDDTKHETRVLTPDEQNIRKEEEAAKESNIVAEGVVSDPEKEITVIDENAIEDIVSAEMGDSDRKTVGTFEDKQEDTVSAERDVCDNEYADIDKSHETRT